MQRASTKEKQNCPDTYNTLLTAPAHGEPLAEALPSGRVTDGERQSAGSITVAGCGERNVWLPQLALVTVTGMGCVYQQASL